MCNNTDFKELAKKILIEVGGSENVICVEHCVTRLRFNLKDYSIVDDKKIENLSGVIGVIHFGGQVQIIIGQQVIILYNEVYKLKNII